MIGWIWYGAGGIWGMKRFFFWQRWLFTTSLFIIAFGVMMALMNGMALFAPFNQGINPVFWGGQEPSAAAVAFQGWVYGVHFNALFNTLLLVLAVLPLGFSWHAFGRGGE
jgi:hypothetical protein